MSDHGGQIASSGGARDDEALGKVGSDARRICSSLLV